SVEKPRTSIDFRLCSRQTSSAAAEPVPIRAAAMASPSHLTIGSSFACPDYAHGGAEVAGQAPVLPPPWPLKPSQTERREVPEQLGSFPPLMLFEASSPAVAQ